MPARISHAVFLLIARTNLCVCPHICCQRIILAGNDADSSQFFMEVFSSTFVKSIYIDCQVFDAVMYGPALYLVVGVSIGYIGIPCL